MNFKQSLDKYLTTPPSDVFNDYCEEVVDNFTDEFYEKNEKLIIEDTKEMDVLIDKLLIKCVEPKKAAKIIERTFKIYKKDDK